MDFMSIAFKPSNRNVEAILTPKPIGDIPSTQRNPSTDFIEPPSTTSQRILCDLTNGELFNRLKFFFTFGTVVSVPIFLEDEKSFSIDFRNIQCSFVKGFVLTSIQFVMEDTNFGYEYFLNAFGENFKFDISVKF